MERVGKRDTVRWTYGGNPSRTHGSNWVSRKNKVGFHWLWTEKRGWLKIEFVGTVGEFHDKNKN